MNRDTDVMARMVCVAVFEGSQAVPTVAHVVH
jgi:hypothetical protein